MPYFVLATAVLLLTSLSFYSGRNGALTMAGGNMRRLHSLPSYYGAYVALWCGLPALLVSVAWTVLQPHVAEWILIGSLPPEAQALPEGRLRLLVHDIESLASGSIARPAPDPVVVEGAAALRQVHLIGSWAMVAVACALAAAGLAIGRSQLSPDLKARNAVERVMTAVMVLASLIAILTTIGIVLSLLFEAIRFFSYVSPIEFLFGTHWSPQIALRPDQAGSSGAFGAVPIFAGTILITAIAMLVAVPIGLLAAIYMADYASHRFRAVAKPLLEILAGIPTVVYGFFAALTVAPFVRGAGESIGLDVSSESALAAGLVMGVMIIPFVSSLSDDVINAVPQSLRDASYGLGATKSETIKNVVLPAALPGIVGAIMLAISRAIGETMIVVMAAGLSANLTANPLEAVTTVTVQIVTLLVGDQEFDSPKTLAAFALGLVLFLVTLTLNVIALYVVRKYREQYD